MPRTVSLLAVALLAGPLLAQPAADPPEIVVEGTKEYDQQVRQFVEALTDAPVGGQLSRFNRAICPAAAGLPELQAQAIAQRMRVVANAAGIEVAAAGCKPNALVIVADDKAELVEGLWAKYPEYFSKPPRGYDKPKDRPGPVAAWHVEALFDTYGKVPGQERIWKYYISESTDSSRLQPSAFPRFIAGVVVIERQALAGLTTIQVADYAAMRIFARTDPTQVARSAPTILHVIDTPMGEAVPITLTDWDLGYLKALYSSGERQFASRQRSEMKTRLRKELADSRPATDK